MISKVNIRVLTLFFLTKDNFHNDYLLVFFIYLKTIKRVSRALLQNTKAAKFPHKFSETGSGRNQRPYSGETRSDSFSRSALFHARYFHTVR
jgi:hypothetical protein